MHWLDKATEIFQSNTIDLRKLAEIAGCDPATFYVGTNMRGADIRGQDLRGMRFTGLNLNEIKCDEHTKFDDENLYLKYKETRIESIQNEISEIVRQPYYHDRLAWYMRLIYLNSDITLDLSIARKDRSIVIKELLPEFIMTLTEKDIHDGRFKHMKFFKFVEKLIKRTYTLNRGHIIRSIYNQFSDVKEISEPLRQSYARYF